MHLSQLDDGQARYVHGLAELPLLCDDPATRALAAQVGLTLQAWLEIDGVTLSKRVQARGDGSLWVTLQVLAPVAHTLAVRQGLAALQALPATAGAVRVPADAVAFARALADAPAWQALLEPARYRAAQLWFAWPLRAAQVWWRQRGASTEPGAATGYQTNLYSFRPSLPVLREVALNHERQRQTRGVPDSLLQLQAERLRQARGARWLAEDLLLADGPQPAAELQQHAATLLAGQPGVRGEPAALPFAPGAYSDALGLACAYDEAWALDPGYVATQATDPAGAPALMLLEPDLPAARLAPATPASRSAATPTAGPFVFISYAHADREQARQVQAWLAQRQLPFWFDGDLVAGDSWSAMLEQRLRDCAGVLLLLSPQAAASRHVRRELQFADHLAKPLLCLRLQDTPLADGLAMLLLPLQWVDHGQPDAQARLVAGVQHLLATPG